jgi:hypothetical protein
MCLRGLTINKSHLERPALTILFSSQAELNFSASTCGFYRFDVLLLSQ